MLINISRTLKCFFSVISFDLAVPESPDLNGMRWSIMLTNHWRPPVFLPLTQLILGIAALPFESKLEICGMALNWLTRPCVGMSRSGGRKCRPRQTAWTMSLVTSDSSLCLLTWKAKMIGHPEWWFQTLLSEQVTSCSCKLRGTWLQKWPDMSSLFFVSAWRLEAGDLSHQSRIAFSGTI
jgi:hypothetical protein